MIHVEQVSANTLVYKKGNLLLKLHPFIGVWYRFVLKVSVVLISITMWFRIICMLMNIDYKVSDLLFLIIFCFCLCKMNIILEYELVLEFLYVIR